MVWSIFLPAYLASIVEFAEALTIVLAIGTSISWKSSLKGAAAGFSILAVLVAVFGSAVAFLVPLNILRIVIGVILVLFGVQWLDKALLRYTGLKAMHDESQIYERNRKQIAGMDTANQAMVERFGFLTSMKSVLLEGLEVAVIVITFGSNVGGNRASGIATTTLAALFALVTVSVLGIAVRKPLTMIPENTFKFVVGIMLTTFGTFWAGEGLGVTWPFSDLFLFVLIGFYLVVCFALIAWLKRRALDPNHREIDHRKDPLLPRILWQIFYFFCGNWTVLFGVIITIAAVLLLEALHTQIGNSYAVGILFMAGIVISFWAALRERTQRISA
ncbi:MAG: hypothetical protein ABF449_06845 [Ethanoligenens sp.]